MFAETDIKEKTVSWFKLVNFNRSSLNINSKMHIDISPYHCKLFYRDILNNLNRSDC